MAPENKNKLQSVKRKYEEKWLNMDAVVAVGIGLAEGEASIIVSVDADPDAVKKQIPETVEGIRVVIRQTGEFKAL